MLEMAKKESVCVSVGICEWMMRERQCCVE